MWRICADLVNPPDFNLLLTDYKMQYRPPFTTVARAITGGNWASLVENKPSNIRNDPLMSLVYTGLQTSEKSLEVHYFCCMSTASSLLTSDVNDKAWLEKLLDRPFSSLFIIFARIDQFYITYSIIVSCMIYSRF